MMAEMQKPGACELVSNTGVKFPQSKPVKVIPYQSRWSEEFLQVKKVFRTVLGDTALRIDHIGSTSVPGLAAKDIIDIQITIADLDDAGEFVDRMLSGGFRQRGDIKYDELTGYPESQKHQLRKRYFREADGNRRMHIHIRQQGYINQRYPLLFRDYLRNNEIVRLSYETIKYRLSEFFPHQIEGYLYIKDPVMDIIFSGAESWAELTGWQPDEFAIVNQ